ncbi:hypothetical protein AVL50_24330 [Flammeovirga sp. SJP92]|nr:hypothetical protein AVL50_24330 [Flammeovirga sp. SJP92]
MDKKMRFENKVCWITGASSGIGKAVTLLLSQQNPKLILSARNQDKLEKVKKSIDPKVEVSILPLDLADDKEVLHQKAKEAYSIYEMIDCIFHIGGISQRAGFEETSYDTFEQIFKVNFWGPLYLTKASLPYLREVSNPIIVSINSVQGKFGVPERTAYSSSKHALLGFFDSLRAENVIPNLQITNILPGYVKTDLAKNALLGDGSTQGHLDEGKGGITVEKAALDIVKAVTNGKSEVVIGRPREKIAVLIKRFLPKIFEKLVSSS